MVAAACRILRRRPVATMSYSALASSKNEKTMGKNIEDIIEESGLLRTNPTKGVRVQGVTCPFGGARRQIHYEDEAVVR